MQDRPTADELLRAVELVMDQQLLPALDGAQKYNARVATNVIRMLRRELQHEDRQLDAEWRGLDIVLGQAPRPNNATALKRGLLERNAELSERIGAGDADAGEFRTTVVAHVRDVVHAKLEVSNPGWLEADA